MKKYIALLLALVMLLSVTACQQPAAPATDGPATTDAPGATETQGTTETGGAAFTAGTYTADAKGHNGNVKVQVEFSEDAIVAIEVLEQEETKGLTDPALNDLPKEIIEAQSTGVDSITGATVTSMAVKAAVNDCIAQAGGDTAAWSKAPDKAPSTEVVNLETDVVVVGAGSAGLTVALSTKAQGLDVVLLEKTASPGGHTLLSGGLVVITGSKVQEEKYGVTEDSPEQTYNDMWVNGHEKSVPELLELLSNNIGEAIDWTIDYVGAELEEKLYPSAEYSSPKSTEYKGKGIGLINSLVKKAEEDGIELYRNTRADKLIVEDGKVMGVEAKAKDGTTYNIRAKATVLATGGFGNNKELLPDNLKRYIYYGGSSSSGDGLIMAKEVGADTVNMEYAERFPNGIEWQPGLAKSSYYGSNAANRLNGILLDRSGNRVVNETGPDPAIIAAQDAQEDTTLFLFMDKLGFETFRENIGGTGISQTMIDEWLELNGKGTPIVAQGATIEEVCETVGIDAANAKATVEKFNGFVQNGKDEDFDRQEEFLKTEIGEGPHYLVEQKPRYATTLGGLRVNTHLEVLNTEGEIIPGLYAAGEAAGGTLGDDSSPGADVTWALVSGRVLSEYLPTVIEK